MKPNDRTTKHDAGERRHGASRPASMATFLVVGASALAAWAYSATAAPRATRPAGDPPAGVVSSSPQGIEETRLTLNKWIETQQILSKERTEWAQGREILEGRIELVEREAAALKEKIQATVDAVNESNKKRDALTARKDELDATVQRLAAAVTKTEAQLRTLFPTLPQPVQDKLRPLEQRIPQDPASTKVSVAERFQNVLGILNELNKANTEIAVTYEVRELANGKSSEVQAIYVGLAQAYYHGPNGEAGIGRPSPKGWTWEPSGTIGNDVLTALEILQGKHTPAFVPLPVHIQ